MKLSTPFITLALAIASVRATYFTGDVVNKVKVISDLDISNLEYGRVHRFYLKASEYNSGAPIYVPVIVARGNQPSNQGKTMWLSSTVHGDELNGIKVIFDVMDAVDVNSINGTIIAVPGVNVPGMSRNLRWYPGATSNLVLTDPNRLFPGTNLTEGGSAATNFAYNIWYGLTKNATQVDVAIDLHTPSTGSTSPLWAYVDYEVPGARRLADLSGADIIKIDPGEPGSVETTFVQSGVPAITLEICTPKRWEPECISRSRDFVIRALNDWGITDINVPNADQSLTYAGNTFFGPSALSGGFFEPNVELLQDVNEGDLLGVQYNTFGDVIHEYYAEAAGRVWNIAYDPARDPGAGLVSLIRNSTSS